MSSALGVLSFAAAVALVTVFSALNETARVDKQAVLVAICCILSCALYVFLMIIYHMVTFVMSHIEHMDGRRRYAQLANQSEKKIVVSTIYIGGTGTFLSLSGLCMWDVTVSVVFLLSLTAVSAMEPQKHADFKRNVDVAKATKTLANLHYALHLSILGALWTILWQDIFTVKSSPWDQNWPMLMFSVAGPLLLRGSCGPPPSQVLEAGLPVGTLWSILVLCWYNNQLHAMFEGTDPSFFVPFLVLCPPALVAILAFVLQGLRRRRTTLALLFMVTALTIRQQVLDTKMMHTLDWFCIVNLLSMLGAAGWLHLFCRTNTERYEATHSLSATVDDEEEGKHLVLSEELDMPDGQAAHTPGHCRTYPSAQLEEQPLAPGNA